MSEAKEQEALIQRAQYHPVTRELIYAIPNDGIRTPLQGVKFKRRGLRPGMPDICLPYPSNGFHALYIELKTKTGKPTTEQLRCLDNLRKAGNAALVAYGWEQAWEFITDYLTPKDMNIKFEHGMQIQNVSYTNGNWNITMTGNEWPWMMKLAKAVRCPDCGTLNLRKNGITYKHKQQYQCLNEACNRVSFTAE